MIAGSERVGRTKNFASPASLKQHSEKKETEPQKKKNRRLGIARRICACLRVDSVDDHDPEVSVQGGDVQAPDGVANLVFSSTRGGSGARFAHDLRTCEGKVKAPNGSNNEVSWSPSPGRKRWRNWRRFCIFTVTVQARNHSIPSIYANSASAYSTSLSLSLSLLLADARGDAALSMLRGTR